MGIVIRCDVCLRTLGREAVALSSTKTARLTNQATETRTVDLDEGTHRLLCRRCARYIGRCIEYLSTSRSRA